MIISIVLVIIGACLLYVGGEMLVRSSTNLAKKLGVSSLVIGLTVVAFGTSSPELAATLMSAFQGVPEVAIGNVIGSNIANIGLILGLTAITYPLLTRRAFALQEVPIMILVMLLAIPVLWDGQVARFEGLALVLFLALYLFYQFRKGSSTIKLEVETTTMPIWLAVLGTALGVAILVVGARILVSGAVTIAQSLGVSERIIGLTIVAFGTSLPELASSLVAAIKKETDLILGNIIGSNVFNVLAILGITALVFPINPNFNSLMSNTGLLIDIGLMMFLGVLIIPFMLGKSRLERVEGLVLFTIYIVYIVFLYTFNLQVIPT